MSGAPTHLLMGALSAAAQVAMARHGQQHDQAMMQLKAGALGQMLDALVHRRVDAVQSGFEKILDGYAEQARHLMAQQTTFSAEQLRADDPLVRVELGQRLRDIDAQLGHIRADAGLLYRRMTEVVLLLGGSSLNFGGDIGSALGLPMGPMGMPA